MAPISTRQQEIAELIGGGDLQKNWRDWRWQLRSVTPYYLSLIDAVNYRNDPVYRQSFPNPRELEHLPCEMADPLAEDQDSPAPGITHRYPDRVLFHISNICSMYCRHCTRKRKVGDRDSIPSADEIRQGWTTFARRRQVRDVLLSGGDPLMLPDEQLDWILGELRAIPTWKLSASARACRWFCPTGSPTIWCNHAQKHHPLWSTRISIIRAN
jgi:lysine 2,3-aminomutase